MRKVAFGLASEFAGSAPSERCDMSERRFGLVEATHMSRAGCLWLYETGHVYTLPRAVRR